MAHSLIIQLGKERFDKKEHFTIFEVSEDPVLTLRSDWAGAEGYFPDIASDIARELRSVCFINKKRKTLTFKSHGTLTRLYVHSLYDIAKEVSASLGGKRTGLKSLRRHSEIVGAVERVAETSRYLFYYQNADDPFPVCHTLSELVLDYLNGWIPKKLHIGGLLDYHF